MSEANATESELETLVLNVLRLSQLVGRLEALREVSEMLERVLGSHTHTHH
jgi:hypothetical protein